MLSRIKFEIEPMVEDMLNQLPMGMWTSKTSTFFDPAIGGGQFVRAIEHRLRSHGHSDKNISQRVFGFEDSELHIRYAVNKYQLVGQYVKKPYEKFLEMDNTMKFDVVVGNPPFQKSNNDAKRWTLWEQFVKKAFELSDHVAMVTPQSITSPGPFALIKDRVDVINIDVSKHFNVGSTFCYFVANNKTTPGMTKLITGGTEFSVDVSKLPFLPFVINEDTLEQINWLKQRTPKKWKRGELHTSNKDLFSTTGQYTVMHTNAQELRTDTVHPNLQKIRVCVSLSGYPKFQVIKDSYASQACMWTEFSSIKKAKEFVKECNDPYVQNILKVFKWSGWNSKEVIEYL